jgi:hypothetical protein
MIVLSKSRFVSGTQCEKKLYFDFFRKDLKPEVTPQQQALFDTGHIIGELAQLVFPGGRDASPENYSDFSASLANTRNWISEGVLTIYEAAFSHDGGFAALDILHHTGGERWAIEVKSSTSVQEYHITDASYQYWVMKQAGYAPDRIFLMHINNKYIKQGAIDPKALFHLEEITGKVLANLNWVANKKGELAGMLNLGSEPFIEIGKHCKSPFACEYMHHCWSRIPENSVFQLSNAKGKEWKLYDQRILSMEEIPDNFKLSHRQQMQVNGAKYDTKHIDVTKIEDFFKKFEYPLYFFDYETISPAIPVLNGTSPFNQVPFQYSLHITDETGNITSHLEFLAKPDEFADVNSIEDDPRYKLVAQMKHDIGDSGSIVAYNAPFEISRIKDLAVAFPGEKEFLESLIGRFVDLIIPFKKAWYYLPEMGATASIKSVLPAIAPEFSYKDLEVSNGGMASSIFLAMVNGVYEGNEAETRKNLLKYCERDTEGMVIIYRHLKEMIENHNF